MNGDTSTRSRHGINLPLLTVECSVVSSKNGSLMAVDCAPTREQYRAWCDLTDEVPEPKRGRRQCSKAP